MALYGAFSSAMMGMMSQSTSLDNIGSNIANVSTGGFKRTDIGFSTVLSKTVQNISDLGGVKPISSQRIDVGGNIISSSRNMDVAISGQGMFVLNTAIDGSGDTFYSRDGSFTTKTGDDITVTADDGVSTITTQEAYLVDKNGLYVMGWQPQTDGSFNTSSTMSAMRVDAYAFLANSIATSTASLDLNLPANDAAGSQHLYGIEVYDSSGAAHTMTLEFTKDAVNNSWTATPSYTDAAGAIAQVDTIALAGTVEAGDIYTVTVSGVTINYTATGAEGTIGTVRDNILSLISTNPTIGNTVTAAASGASSITLTSNTPGTGFTSSASATTGAIVDNTATQSTTTANDTGLRTGTPTTLTFDGDAQLVSPTNLSLTGSWTGDGSVTIDLDISNFTQFAGGFTPYNYTQNGFGSGQLREISFDNQGRVQGQFTNTQVRALYRLGLAVFSNPNGLDMISGNLFKESPDSGSATTIAPDSNSFGSISGNALEMSNVDVAEEFTRMIVTQQAYNSSATVFKTVDEMTTVARDLKR